ncbi:hypothetical protein V2J09_007571 [Rumex salicifolius]
MQGLLRAVQNGLRRNQAHIKKLFVVSPHSIHQRGLENTKVEDVLMIKNGENVGSWLWCHTNDTVHDAVKKMAQHNVGSLVVLKPGDEQLIAGIITERDYLRKVAAEGRENQYTKVSEIMTDESRLITVNSDMSVLQAMQLMTENHIRHVPVINGKIIGMLSIQDVVKAVVEQQSGELKRLNEFIKGDYY